MIRIRHKLLRQRKDQCYPFESFEVYFPIPKERWAQVWQNMVHCKGTIDILFLGEGGRQENEKTEHRMMSSCRGLSLGDSAR